MSHEDWSSKSFRFRFSSKKQKIYRIHSSTLVYICIICTISSHSSPPKKLQFLPYFPIQETCELLQSQIPKERCWTFKTVPEKCSHSIDGLKPTYVGCCSLESEVAGKLWGMTTFLRSVHVSNTKAVFVCPSKGLHCFAIFWVECFCIEQSWMQLKQVWLKMVP